MTNIKKQVTINIEVLEDIKGKPLLTGAHIETLEGLIQFANEGNLFLRIGDKLYKVSSDTDNSVA